MEKTPGQPFSPSLPSVVVFQACGLHEGARGMGKPLLCPLPLLPCSPEMVFPITSPGITVITYRQLLPVLPLSFPPLSFLIQVIPVPIPSASLMHAEGPGTPQVLCLSNKVETTKPGCQATLYVELSGGAWWGCGRGRMNKVPLCSIVKCGMWCRLWQGRKQLLCSYTLSSDIDYSSRMLGWFPSTRRGRVYKQWF